ncbi:hypothetical protein HELRODRAFT_176121 [Helobdella robusta]|uniref:Endonuclease/exonuclease/phosphatase domain-containing protein n=1 Tax=Helobdella robusta TaxID=6412 RepID=T1FA60_HELRO|nr:hypothetical protein HELRODRAFT_176121 [Helobdella robusta]ESO00263.1 hypothetical protein HELRODRAFT_176121 [Helobdella robusta]
MTKKCPGHDKTVSTLPCVLLSKRLGPLLITGDLNGHVGEKTDGFDNVHGGFGYGERNEDGNRILEFAESHGFCLLNTYFRKRLEHLIIYKSGPSATQIDFSAVKQKHRRLFKNVKVIPGESCFVFQLFKTTKHNNDIFECRRVSSVAKSTMSRAVTQWLGSKTVGHETCVDLLLEHYVKNVLIPNLSTMVSTSDSKLKCFFGNKFTPLHCSA